MALAFHHDMSWRGFISLSTCIIGLFICIYSSVNYANDTNNMINRQCSISITYPNPILTDTYYDWGLQVKPDSCDSDKEEWHVKGYMPAHAHGLPSAPHFIKKKKGNYVIKGIYFNMMGTWKFNVYHGDKLIEQYNLRVYSF